MVESKTNILLVDDHPMVNDGLRMCLEVQGDFVVTGMAANGKDALKFLKKNNVDIVIMDINMPDMDGLTALSEIKLLTDPPKVIMLSLHSSKEYVKRAVKDGASGFLLKDVPFNEVIAAIQAVKRGSTYFCETASKLLFSQFDDDTVQLTEQEKRILKLIADGYSNKLVARELDISVRTAETHRRNIKRKLEINTTAELTRYAIENRLSLE